MARRAGGSKPVFTPAGRTAPAAAFAPHEQPTAQRGDQRQGGLRPVRRDVVRGARGRGFQGAEKKQNRQSRASARQRQARHAPAETQQITRRSEQSHVAAAGTGDGGKGKLHSGVNGADRCAPGLFAKTSTMLQKNWMPEHLAKIIRKITENRRNGKRIAISPPSRSALPGPVGERSGSFDPPTVGPSLSSRLSAARGIREGQGQPTPHSLSPAPVLRFFPARPRGGEDAPVRRPSVRLSPLADSGGRGCFFP